MGVAQPDTRSFVSPGCRSKMQTGVRPQLTPFSNLACVALRHQREINATYGIALKQGPHFHKPNTKSVSTQWRWKFLGLFRVFEQRNVLPTPWIGPRKIHATVRELHAGDRTRPNRGVFGGSHERSLCRKNRAGGENIALGATNKYINTHNHKGSL